MTSFFFCKLGDDLKRSLKKIYFFNFETVTLFEFVFFFWEHFFPFLIQRMRIFENTQISSILFC